jgi:hypothetical protein
MNGWISSESNSIVARRLGFYWTGFILFGGAVSPPYEAWVLVHRLSGLERSRSPIDQALVLVSVTITFEAQLQLSQSGDF